LEELGQRKVVGVGSRAGPPIEGAAISRLGFIQGAAERPSGASVVFETETNLRNNAALDRSDEGRGNGLTLAMGCECTADLFARRADNSEPVIEPCAADVRGKADVGDAIGTV